MPSPTDHNLTALPTKTVKLPARRQARHFTTLDQVTQLVAARNTDAELCFVRGRGNGGVSLLHG